MREVWVLKSMRALGSTQMKLTSLALFSLYNDSSRAHWDGEAESWGVIYISPWESNVQALRYTIVTAAGLTPDRLEFYQRTEV